MGGLSVVVSFGAGSAGVGAGVTWPGNGVKGLSGTAGAIGLIGRGTTGAIGAGAATGGGVGVPAAPPLPAEDGVGRGALLLSPVELERTIPIGSSRRGNSRTWESVPDQISRNVLPAWFWPRIMRGVIDKTFSVFSTENKRSLKLQLAAWRPGRYELGNFSKNIRQKM